jgi:hypothetical protein
VVFAAEDWTGPIWPKSVSSDQNSNASAP